MSILRGGSVECVDESVSFIELDSPWHIVTTLLNTVPTFMNQKDPKSGFQNTLRGVYIWIRGEENAVVAKKVCGPGTRRKRGGAACLHIMHQLNLIVFWSLFRCRYLGN